MDSERLLRSVLGRDLTVHLSRGTEDRLRAYIDRYNNYISRHPRFVPEDLMDPNSDEGLACAFEACAERGLREAEAEDGLEGRPWGEILSAEQAAEIRRRRNPNPKEEQ